MRQVAQFVGILLLIGFVGAYFWPIALTAAAFGLTRPIHHSITRPAVPARVSATAVS